MQRGIGGELLTDVNDFFIFIFIVLTLFEYTFKRVLFF